MLMVTTSTTFAQTSQHQRLETRSEVECESSGSYGQNVHCRAEAEAEGEQNQTLEQRRVVVKSAECEEFVTRKDGTVVCVHDTVNAGLEPSTLAAAAVSSLSGIGAFVVRRRLAS
ncbi:MAG: hypothetical protein COU69_02895 [Candidatus Pacebacteria bacterium CG10_big_fil_rev_8_21_14_0_10_56_10]|nr:MAG: hypothetical protein COU69_02895 [Candidatus Pacebacteria bacterium CG10_big_fil_rev_8_21_14_0_10_56_10]